MGSGIERSFFTAPVEGPAGIFVDSACWDDEHVVMIDWMVKCDPDSFFATSGNFSKSLFMSNRGMLVT